MLPLLGKPFDGFHIGNSVSQYFGCNRDIYLPNFGIPGHNAIDCINPDSKLGYGTKLNALHDFDTVEIESDFPNKTKGNGIRMRGRITDREIRVNGMVAGFMETIHWHVADFVIKAPASGKRGDIVALMGNTGFVNPKPSNACPLCPYYGTHSHTGLRFYDQHGNLIQNEYNGYRDPIPYMFDPRAGEQFNMYFAHDLWLGSQGDEVSWLQTILKIEGFADDYDPIGSFGKKTVRDVARLQQKYGLTPALGYVGSKTRALLNEKYCL